MKRNRISKKIIFGISKVLLLTFLLSLNFDFAFAQALKKRTYYDLFGESRNTVSRVYELADINGTGGGYTNLRSLGWGLFGDNAQRVTYTDRSKNMTATLKLGVDWWASTEIFNEILSPFMFNRLRMSGIDGEIKYKNIDSFKFMFSRTFPPMSSFGVAYKNTYLIGLYNEYKFKWDPVNLSLGAGVLNHWRETGLSGENSLDGDVENNPPSYLYLKFSDDSPEDGFGSALYGIQYSKDGSTWLSITPATAPEPGGGGSIYPGGGGSREVNGANYFTYRILLNTLGTTSTLQKVQLKIDIANDYKIEIFSHLSITTLNYNSKGKVIDYSNRAILPITYGLPSANRIYGFNVKGKIADLNLEMEYAINQRFRKYPSSKGEFANDLSSALYLKFNCPFFNNILNIGGNYFSADPEYSTSFDGYDYISDNDDKDNLPDGLQAGVGYVIDPYSPLPTFYDADSNNRVDWEDAFFYKSIPSKLLIGEDHNNNGVPDNYDDDLKPDLRPDQPYYNVDVQGYQAFVECKLLKDLNLKFGVDDFKRISSLLSTRNTYFVTLYSTKVPGFGPFYIRNEIKSAKDDIPDDLFYEGNDRMLMKDSMVNVFDLEGVYDAFKKLEVTNKVKLLTNYQAGSKTMNRWSGALSRVSYDYKPTGVWTITPQYKFVWQSGDNEYQENAQDNIFIIKTMYKIFSQTALTGGAEFRFTRNLMDTSLHYNKQTYAFQVVSSAGTYQLFTGYKREVLEYYNNPVRNEKNDMIFFGIYHTTRMW